MLRDLGRSAFQFVPNDLCIFGALGGCSMKCLLNSLFQSSFFHFNILFTALVLHLILLDFIMFLISQFFHTYLRKALWTVSVCIETWSFSGQRYSNSSSCVFIMARHIPMDIDCVCTAAPRMFVCCYPLLPQTE